MARALLPNSLDRNAGKASAGRHVRDWEMISYDVDRFIVGEGGDEIVMVGRCGWRNKATGKVADIPKVDIHTFRDGKVVRFQEVYDTLGFARALGAV
jgi:uncharacterized protein